jgi:hypothetical protein
LILLLAGLIVRLGPGKTSLTQTFVHGAFGLVTGAKDADKDTAFVVASFEGVYGFLTTCKVLVGEF